LEIALSENSEFVNQIFDVLFVRKTHPEFFVSINDGDVSDLESCTSSESA